MTNQPYSAVSLLLTDIEGSTRLADHPRKLPTQPTWLTGCEAKAAEMRSLSAGARLLTLTGIAALGRLHAV